MDRRAVLLLVVLVQASAALRLDYASPRPLGHVRREVASNKDDERLGATAAAQRLRGGATAISDAPLWLAWLRVIRRVVFPGNPPRSRAPYVPPPPASSSPAADSSGGQLKNRAQSRGGQRSARAGAVHSVHSKAEFDKAVASARAKQLVVVDFAASWCGPCQQIAPKYEAMAAALPHVRFLKVDVDECKDLSQEYGVKSMPTFKMLRAGKEVDEMKGADEGALREKVEALAGKPDRWASAGAGRQL